LIYRQEIDKIFTELFPIHIQAVKDKKTPNPTDFDCLRKMVSGFEDKCLKLDSYGLKFAGAFAAECEGLKSYPEAQEQSLKRMETVCSKNEYVTKVKA